MMGGHVVFTGTVSLVFVAVTEDRDMGECYKLQIDDPKL